MKELIKKYSNHIICFAALFLVLFINFYGTNDLFSFPFVAGVWGNVSDWCMVIVTILTAIYLVKTFSEQKKANDISLKIYKRGIMPYFTVLRVQEEDRFYLELKANNNTIRNMSFSNINDGYIYNANDFFKNAIVAKESSISIPMQEVFPRGPILVKPVEVIHIKYSDNEMNFYIQVVSFYYGPSWTVSDPEPCE